MKQISHHHQIVNQVVTTQIPYLTSTQKSVLSAISTFVSLKDGSAFPSQEKLSELTGFHRVTVNKAIKVISELGYLVVSKIKRVVGIGFRNSYKVTDHLLSVLGFGKNTKSKKINPPKNPPRIDPQTTLPTSYANVSVLDKTLSDVFEAGMGYLGYSSDIEGINL